MSFSSMWLNITTRQTFRLSLSNRVIYDATHEDINSKKDVNELLGDIIVPLSEGFMRRTFVVYMNSKSEVSIAPVRLHHRKFIESNRSVFQKPLDIRRLYDIIDL